MNLAEILVSVAIFLSQNKDVVCCNYTSEGKGVLLVGRLKRLKSRVTFFAV